MPLFGLLAAGAFLVAVRSYEPDMRRVNDRLREEAAGASDAPPQGVQGPAPSLS
jgi:hypothetical protein